jgi:signal transduction histidine kinase
MPIPRLLRTATFRLTALYVLLFVVSVGVLGALLIFTARSTAQAEARAQISSEVNLLLYEFREDGLEELLEEIEERIDKSADGQRLLYMVQSPNGRVIFDRVVPAAGAPGWQRFNGDAPREFHFTLLDNGYMLGVGKDLAGMQATHKALASTVGWVLAAALLMGACGGLILSRRTLAQVQGITRTAREVGEGRLSRRIELRNTGDELDALGHTLNGMLDKIESLVSNVRHVSTGIAHDLRTPLARLRNHLEDLSAQAPGGVQAQGLVAAIAEVDSILQIFNAMLRLAEVEAGTLKAGFKPLDLSALVRKLVDAYQPLAEDRGASIAARIADGLVIRGDAALLQQLLANLIENALQYGGPEAEVLVSLECERGHMRMGVADRGSGIPAEHRARVMKPFQRMDSNPAHCGFGLALAAAIARLHDASLVLLDNDPGLLCVAEFTPSNPARQDS